MLGRKKQRQIQSSEQLWIGSARLDGEGGGDEPVFT